jgi:hypothetical protein
MTEEEGRRKIKEEESRKKINELDVNQAAEAAATAAAATNLPMQLGFRDSGFRVQGLGFRV